MEGILAKITTLKNVFSDKNLQPSYEAISALFIVLHGLISTAITVFSTDRGSELPVQCNVGCSDTIRPDHDYNISEINEECQKQFHSFVKHWYSPVYLCFGCFFVILGLWLWWNMFPCNRIKRALGGIRELEDYLKPNTDLTPDKLVDFITQPSSTWNDKAREGAELIVVDIRNSLFCRKTESMSPILLYTVINFVTLVIHIVIVVGGLWIYFDAWTFTCDWNNECFNCTAVDIYVRPLFCVLVIVIGFGALPRMLAVYSSFPLFKEYCQQLPENCTEKFRQNIQDNKFVVLFSKSASMCLSTRASHLLAVELEEWLDRVRNTNVGLNRDNCDEPFKIFIGNVLIENNLNHVSEMQIDVVNETLNQPPTTPPESSETDIQSDDRWGDGDDSNRSYKSSIARQGINSPSISNGSTGSQNSVIPEPRAEKKYAAIETKNGKSSELSPMLTESSGTGERRNAESSGSSSDSFKSAESDL